MEKSDGNYINEKKERNINDKNIITALRENWIIACD